MWFLPLICVQAQEDLDQELERKLIHVVGCHVARFSSVAPFCGQAAAEGTFTSKALSKQALMVEANSSLSQVELGATGCKKVAQFGNVQWQAGHAFGLLSLPQSLPPSLAFNLTVQALLTCTAQLVIQLFELLCLAQQAQRHASSRTTALLRLWPGSLIVLLPPACLLSPSSLAQQMFAE